jgi:predicted nucleotidyltransferase
MVRTEAEIQHIVNKFVDYISKEIRVNKVILFGSYANGTATEESDIDIAIDSPDFSEDYLAECERLNRSVWRSGTDLGIEPHPLHPVMQDFFVEEILKTGIVIYEATD